MLTSANVTANMAAGYYAADNYYSAGAVLSEPVWMGAFAAELGLEGPLDTRNFEQMLRGFGPDGRPLISHPEYPHQAKRVVSADTKREVLAGVRELLDQAGVKPDETRRAIERTLEKNLDKGELREKMIARLSRRLGNAIEASTLGRSGEEDRGEARTAVRSLLEKAKAPSPRRAAVDLTLSAPKSVSIQALVFGDTRLVEAHRAAVRQVMQYAEEHFAACRVGSREDRRSVTTGKYAIAQFEHDLSREKDPHLHTHNVIINMTPAEGKVRALHNDDLYQHKRMLGTIYQNELALRVRELGYDIERNRNGMFEIAGYAREQIEAFSKRHLQLWEQGASSQADIHKDFYEGRRAKEANLDRASLKEEWSRACEAGGLRSVHGKPERGAVLGGPAASMEGDVAALTEKSVSVRLQDLQTARLSSKLGEGPSQGVIEEAALYANVALVAGKAARTYTTPEALGLEASYRADVVAGIGNASAFLDADRCNVLRERLRAGNQLSPQARSEAVSSALRAAETIGVREPACARLQGVLEGALEGGEKLAPKALYSLRRGVEDVLRSEGRKGKALTTALRGVLDPFEKRAQAMTEGQIEAVCATAGSRDGVIVWQGVAGAGKTFSMSRVVEIARDAGYEPKGFAPSAAAAAQLSQDTGISAMTLDSHLLRLEGSRREGGRGQEARQQTAPELWIVDEASMLSARAFTALTAHARERGARLLLVGDERQISAVEAGNPFLDVQKETKTTFASLSESVRQRTPQLQRVVKHLYAGQHSEAAKGLRQETLEAPTREARCKVAARSYLALPRGEQAQTLLLASTNEERRLVTAEVRAGLAASGRLGAEATVTTLRALELADVHKKQAANLLPGYVVKFQGELPRWARRGEAYEVTSIDVRENAVRLRDANRKDRIVPCESLSRATFYRKEELALAKGDRVVWTQNDRRLGVLNNDTFEVSKVSKMGVTLQSATGMRKGRLTLSTDGLHHLDHAWALTVYRSQGQTSKNVILVADEGMSARELLVGVTRATQGVLIVAHDREDIEKLAAKRDGKHIAHEVALVVPSTQAPRQAMRDERERTQERGGWDVASF